MGFIDLLCEKTNWESVPQFLQHLLFEEEEQFNQELCV